MEDDKTLLLYTAATYGDVEYLREALATQPVEDFLAVSPTDNGQFNIVQVAVLGLQEEILRELVTKLPPSAVHTLISQQDLTESKVNAIHYAAIRGDVGILRVLLDVYRTTKSTDTVEGRPWLAKDSMGSTPLHRALEQAKDECALEIMGMDMEVLCSMVDDKGTSPLLEAVRRKCPRVAVQILTCPHGYSTSGYEDFTPLDLAPNSTEEVCRLLLQKHPEMLKNADQHGITFLHVWVRIGVLWPFHILLEQESTSAWRKIFIDLLCAPAKGGNNPLHVAASIINKETIQIAKLLVEAYVQAYEMEKEEIVRLSPWVRKNSNGDTPLMVALSSRNEELVKYRIGSVVVVCISCLQLIYNWFI